MHKVTNLQEELLNGMGKPYQGIASDSGDSTEKENLRVFFMVDTLGSATEISGEEKISAYTIAGKIREVTDEDEIEIEDAEAKLLKKVLEKRDLPAAVHAQLTESIVKDEPKKKEAKEEPKKEEATEK